MWWRRQHVSNSSGTNTKTEIEQTVKFTPQLYHKTDKLFLFQVLARVPTLHIKLSCYDLNISSTIGWISMDFCEDIILTQIMNPNHLMSSVGCLHLPNKMSQHLHNYLGTWCEMCYTWTTVLLCFPLCSWLSLKF